MIKGALLDIGGVVAVGANALPGAVEAVSRLRSAGLGVRFVTNITRQSRLSVVGQLNAMGFAVRPEDVFTPAIAARQWLLQNGRVPHLLIHPGLAGDFAGLKQGEPDVLVLGDVGDALDYGLLNQAFRVLAHGGDFIALAQNRVFRDADGALSLDAGAFVAALEYASGKQALVLGKPAPGFFHAAVASMACEPKQAVMVGDDAEFDVAAAVAAGLCGLLVRTGKYAAGAEEKVTPRPTAVVDDIAAAAAWILDRG
ncbi:MAG TPA: TIGR01458 family HAD-type hydrolase [Rhizomicrobium sp.]|nr:TIGR01458 family HAD-type hydrolase [Rhizomicrobium sp.]